MLSICHINVIAKASLGKFKEGDRLHLENSVRTDEIEIPAGEYCVGGVNNETYMLEAVQTRNYVVNMNAVRENPQTYCYCVEKTS